MKTIKISVVTFMKKLHFFFSSFVSEFHLAFSLCVSLCHSQTHTYAAWIMEVSFPDQEKPFCTCKHSSLSLIIRLVLCTHSSLLAAAQNLTEPENLLLNPNSARVSLTPVPTPTMIRLSQQLVHEENFSLEAGRAYTIV